MFSSFIINELKINYLIQYFLHNQQILIHLQNQGNAWQTNNQGNREQSGQNQRPQNNQNQQSTPNFADPNAFGPPLGRRARPNRNNGKICSFASNSYL